MLNRSHWMPATVAHAIWHVPRTALAFCHSNVLAHHAVNDDFEMQLTHTADDGLSAVGIGVNLEGGLPGPVWQAPCPSFPGQP